MAASMQRLRIEVIDRAYAAVLAAKTPAERLSMVFEAYWTARMLAEAGVRYLHPDWTDVQIREEAVKRLAYGPK
jgi:hypothetical protein